jgi:hypothetical protein
MMRRNWDRFGAHPAVSVSGWRRELITLRGEDRGRGPWSVDAPNLLSPYPPAGRSRRFRRSSCVLVAIANPDLEVFGLAPIDERLWRRSGYHPVPVELLDPLLRRLHPAKVERAAQGRQFASSASSATAVSYRTAGRHRGAGHLHRQLTRPNPCALQFADSIRDGWGNSPNTICAWSCWSAARRRWAA